MQSNCTSRFSEHSSDPGFFPEYAVLASRNMTEFEMILWFEEQEENTEELKEEIQSRKEEQERRRREEEDARGNGEEQKNSK